MFLRNLSNFPWTEHEGCSPTTRGEYTPPEGHELVLNPPYCRIRLSCIGVPLVSLSAIWRLMTIESSTPMFRMHRLRCVCLRALKKDGPATHTRSDRTCVG